MILDRLRRLRRLDSARRRLLLAAAMLLGFVSVALRLCRFPTVWRALERIGRPPAGCPPPSPETVASVVAAVALASRYVPATHCLEQALAARVLLARRGQATRLRLGVRRSDEDLHAHAWIESGGEVLIGGLPDLAEFQPLPPLGANAS